MTYATVTLTTANSTTPNGSTAVNLNWIGGKVTSFSASVSSTASADFTIQYTFDDLQRIGGSSLALWANLSTDPFTQLPSSGMSGIHYTASAVAGTDGVLGFLPGPVAAMRLNSTALGAGTLTLKIIQGEAW